MSRRTDPEVARVKKSLHPQDIGYSESETE
jgi:hypothetical protein